MHHHPTNRKNPFQNIFTTEVTRRFERNFPKKQFELTSRSGFNVRKKMEDEMAHKPVKLDSAESSMAKLHALTRSAERLEQMKNLPDAEKNRQMWLREKRKSHLVETFNNTYSFHSKSFKLRAYAQQ